MVENKPPQESEAKPTIEVLSLWSGLLRDAGKIRDVGLVIAAITYVLGYLVWEFHAWRLNIGLLPAFDLQYLIGGAIPILSVVLAALILRLFWGAMTWFDKYIEGFIESHQLNQRLRLGLVGAISLVVFAISLIVSDNIPSGPGEKAFLYLAAVSGVLAFGIVLRYLVRLYIALMLLVFTLMWLIVYVGFVYAEIPQEWGGGKPKCGFVDLAWKEVSSETSNDLLKSNSPDPQAPTARSVELDILYSRGETTVVRTRGDQLGNPATVHQIPKELIRTIAWCP